MSWQMTHADHSRGPWGGYGDSCDSCACRAVLMDGLVWKLLRCTMGATLVVSEYHPVPTVRCSLKKGDV